MNINKFAVTLTIVILILSSGCAGAPAVPATEAPSGNTETPATEAPASTEAPFCKIDQALNPGKTVTLALPGFVLGDPSANGVIFQVTPLAEPPAQGFDDPCGVIVGDLFAARDLPLTDSQLSLLPAGEYRVKVKDGKINFVATDGKEWATSMDANFREISSREVNPPEAIITYKDICFSWLHLQLCTEPAYQYVLNGGEKDAIQGAMENQVKVLAEKGWVNPADINVGGTVPDMAGDAAMQVKQASLLAAPTVNFPSQDGDYPVNGALLGVVYTVMNIDVADYPSLPAGTYTVWAYQGEQGWQGRFVSADGSEIYLPANFLEMRGQIEEPMAIVVDLRLILCWFREHC